MPRISSVAKLPTDLLDEVRFRLRRSAYGNSIEIADWLKNEGHNVSKSAINRYSIELRRVDAARGDSTASILHTRDYGRGKATIRQQLMVELGKLRLAEHRILTRLTELDTEDESGMQGAAPDGGEPLTVASG